MLNKRKLAREILGLSGASLVISIFVFGFLSMTADSLVLSYCEKNELVFSEDMEWAVDSWIQSVSFAAATIIFVFLFLFLVGEKIASAENELQLKEAQLREEKEALIHALAHDIRTPLTSILSYSEYMKEKDRIDDQDVKGYIMLMQQKAEQIKVLTNQLLDGGDRTLERIANGRFLMEQLVSEWCDVLEDRFQCDINLEGCPDFSAEIDVKEFRRIFDNLASNVAKYADSECQVVLRVFEEKNHLVLEQKNKCKQSVSAVESNKIGLESIRKVVAHYGGNVEVVLTEQDFSISITLMEVG